MKPSPVTIDFLLEPLISEANDERADELLSQLITAHAGPVIKNVIRHKLHFNSYRYDLRNESDDLQHDVILQLLAQLQRFRQLPKENPITDLRGMAAIIAHRTCARWMRRQFPERHALKNRLHYLLTRQRGFALWQDQDGKTLSGFAVWQDQKTITRKSQDPELLPIDIRKLRGNKPGGLAEAVAAIFNYADGPIEFDSLVSTMAQLLGVSDQPIESLDQDDSTVAPSITTTEPDAAWRLEKQIFLERLWGELKQLPRNQRVALLLNLKDAGGSGCIALLPATGVATVRQIAGVLEMNAESFAELWNQLPLEDATIANILGLTRQQVINARKSGRERLSRRLKGFI